MKFHVLPASLLSLASVIACATAMADAPVKAPSASAPDLRTPSSGTKGTLYGDLPVGVVSDEYASSAPPKSLSPLPSHLRVKQSDGMAYLTDRSNNEAFSPRNAIYSCILERNSLQAAVTINAEPDSTRSVQSVRLEETANGASLVTDSILLRGGQPAGAFHHGTLPLKKIQTLAGGLVIYGGRDDHNPKRYVHFVVRPPSAEDMRISSLMHAQVLSADGRFQTSNGCGFILVSLPVAQDVASTTLVRMNTLLSAAEIEKPQFDGEVTMAPRVNPPLQREVVTRPVGIAFSASKIAGDTEPRVAVSASWKGDEVTQRVFIMPKKGGQPAQVFSRVSD